MTAIDIAGVIKEYGMTGVSALLILAVCVLFKMLTNSWEARVTDAKVAAQALTTQASTNTELANNMKDLREGQQEIMRVVSLIERDVETGDKGVQDKLQAISSQMTEVNRRIDDVVRGGTR